jgi:hypothetical protein
LKKKLIERSVAQPSTKKKQKNPDAKYERALSQKNFGHSTATPSGLSNLFCVVFGLKPPGMGETPSKC